MKFIIGQPVWSISARDGRWRPGVIVGPEIMRFYFSYAEERDIHALAYHVHVPDGAASPGFRQDKIFCKKGYDLRPRDEGQFTPADESFEWRNKVKETA